MNSKQLAYFLRIAELRSFRKASESLRIAQPALTRQIKILETQLGVELFSRHNEGVTPTSAGALLIERARFILRQTEQARADVMAQGTVPRGTVSFGAPASFAEVLFPRLASAFLAQYPDVKLRFYEGVGHLRDWLTNDQIDLAILPDSELASARNLNLLRLVDELVYLVGAPNEFTLGTFCSPDAVIDRQLILTPPPSTLRGNLDVIVQKLGRELNVIIETESLQVQKSLVRAGLGNALLPHSAIWRASQEGSISVCVVEGWSLARVLAWKANQPMTPAVQRMIEVTNAQVEALAREGAFGRNQIDAQFGSCQAPAAAPVFKT